MHDSEDVELALMALGEGWSQTVAAKRGILDASLL